MPYISESTRSITMLQRRIKELESELQALRSELAKAQAFARANSILGICLEAEDEVQDSGKRGVVIERSLSNESDV